MPRWIDRLLSNRTNARARGHPGAPTPAPGLALTRQQLAETHALHLQRLLGDNATTEALTVPEKLVAQVVEQQLRDRAQRNAAVPRLPVVIPMLLKQLRDPNASGRDYVAIIRQDPTLAAAVLRIANSVYFNPQRHTLDNFERAVGALGIRGLRLVLSTAVMQPILQGRGEQLAHQVWSHSLACAICCQQLAERSAVDPFLAYLTGLVHDVGTITLYNQTLQYSRDHLAGTRPNTALLASLFAQWGALLGYWIAQDWALPSDVVRALAAQAEPDAPQPVLADLLRRANAVSEAWGNLRAGLCDETRFQALVRGAGAPADIAAVLDSAFIDQAERRKC